MTITNSASSRSQSSEARSQEHPSHFVTDHLALASYLASQGHQPALQPTAARTVLFAFTRTADLDVAVDAFNNGSARVEPTAFNAARISLRKQMDTLRGGLR